MTDEEIELEVAIEEYRASNTFGMNALEIFFNHPRYKAATTEQKLEMLQNKLIDVMKYDDAISKEQALAFCNITELYTEVVEQLSEVTHWFHCKGIDLSQYGWNKTKPKGKE